MGTRHAQTTAGTVDPPEILRALDELALAVPTAELPHPIEGPLSNEHVAVPSGTVATATRVEAARDGSRLSDHDAYVVDTDP